MLRYIDAEDINNNFRGELCKGIDCDSCKFHHGSYFCKLADYINNYPIADVAPVIHGHWIYQGLSPYNCFSRCSCCDVVFDGYETLEYCPKCGAKMDEVMG